jgi:hypothetical protein
MALPEGPAFSINGFKPQASSLKPKAASVALVISTRAGWLPRSTRSKVPLSRLLAITRVN